jgi:hypothetical protein
MRKGKGHQGDARACDGPHQQRERSHTREKQEKRGNGYREGTVEREEADKRSAKGSQAKDTKKKETEKRKARARTDSQGSLVVWIPL